MQINIYSIITSLIILTCVSACNNTHIASSVYLEHPPTSVFYPALLPVEKAHKAALRLRADPPIDLNAKDLKDITNLAGRVPGLHEYKITLINESIMYPGCYNVYVVRSYVIYMIKDTEWRVYKVGISIP